MRINVVIISDVVPCASRCEAKCLVVVQPFIRVREHLIVVDEVQFASQAVLMAEELIKKNLQKDDQVKLVEDYLEKVGTVQ